MIKIFLIDIIDEQNECYYHFIMIIIEVYNRECKDDLFL